MFQKSILKSQFSKVSFKSQLCKSQLSRVTWPRFPRFSGIPRDSFENMNFKINLAGTVPTNIYIYIYIYIYSLEIFIVLVRERERERERERTEG